MDFITYAAAVKAARKGVPYVEKGGMVEIYPETTLDFSNDTEAVLTNGADLGVGVEYTVKWNGVEYNCVAQDVSSMLGGIQCYALGNMVEAGGTDTGEPFYIVLIHPDEVATVGLGGIVNAFDGATSVTFSIMGAELIYHKIHASLLPDTLNGVAKQLVVNVQCDSNGANATVDKTFYETVIAAVGGTIVSAKVTIADSAYVFYAPLAAYSDDDIYFSVYIAGIDTYVLVVFQSDETVTVTLKRPV